MSTTDSLPTQETTQDANRISGFALWHPKHGFHQPYHYEGPIAYARSDDAIEDTRQLNRECGQNNRNGWRIVSVNITRQHNSSS